MNRIQHESAKLGNGRIREGYFDINKTSINARLKNQTAPSLIGVNESLRIDNSNGLINDSCEMINKYTSPIGVNDFNLTQGTLHYGSSFFEPTVSHLKEMADTDALLGNSLSWLESTDGVKALEFNSRNAINTGPNTPSLYDESASDMFDVAGIPFMSEIGNVNVLGRTSKGVSVRTSALNGRLNNTTWLGEGKINHAISKRDTILNGPDITTFQNILQSDSLIANYKNSYEDVKYFAAGKIEEVIKESIDISDETRQGRSGSQNETNYKSGELDIGIRDPKTGNIISIIEALELNSCGSNNQVVEEHINKLIKHYDTAGNELNYVVVYSTAKVFSDLWDKYKEHIEKVVFGEEVKFEVICKKSFNKSRIRVEQTINKSDNFNQKLIHFFVDMST